MSSMSAAAPDPTQELGAEDEVTAFNNEEEGEYEGDESLNDIKDELQLEADSDKAKVCACVRMYVRFGPMCVSCSYLQLLVLVVCLFSFRPPLATHKLLSVSCQLYSLMATALNVFLCYLPSHCPSISSESTYISGMSNTPVSFIC